MSEQMWMERAQTAEATIMTQKESFERAITKVKEFKTAFGIREKNTGEIDIDFDKFVQALGIESALELRLIIDNHYQISGAAGQKPHIRMIA
jgi:hypothetical protein